MVELIEQVGAVVHGVHDVAAGECLGGIGGAGRARCRRCRGPDRAGCRSGPGQRWRGLGFQGPLLLGTVDLAQVVDAGVLLRGRAGAHEVGDGDGGQQADDGHHDHDFHQREARLFDGIEFHSFEFSFAFAA